MQVLTTTNKERSDTAQLATFVREQEMRETLSQWEKRSGSL